MKIGIDARMFGLSHAGSGRYIENLIFNLLKIDTKNFYVLFIRARQAGEISLKLRPFCHKFKLVEIEAEHYSLKEQWLLPYLIRKEQVGLVHFPQFNIPIFYFGKYVVTIHDLIKHDFRGLATTTRNPWFYWLKYLGYKLVFQKAVKGASLVFVPSKTVAGQLKEIYGLDTAKIKVTYEGVDERLKPDPESVTAKTKLPAEIAKKYKIKKPFFLYVGSVYPHKNLENLIKAFKLLGRVRYRLVIVCARSVFRERLVRTINRLEAQNLVDLVDFIPDEELRIFYQLAEAYIFPSLAEGFGLPGLEAMANGLPVLASQIPTLREIYQQAAQYFDPLSPEDIAQKIMDFLRNSQQRDRLRKEGYKIVELYSWEKMAKETLDGYCQV